MKQFGNASQILSAKTENQSKWRKLCFQTPNSEKIVETPQISCLYESELILHKEIDKLDNVFSNYSTW